MEPDESPEPGQNLAHYRIERLLGRGGMGAVFLAEDRKLGRKVALKVLPPELAASPERLERFRREARALAALDHPGIVTVYSVEESDGVHFLTVQLVDGEPLDRSIQQGGMSCEDLLSITAELAEALTAAHEKRIIHRHLKPANVMRTKEGRVKVLDFGLAKIIGPPDASRSEISTVVETRQGVVMGTAPYMSPEQVQGRELDHRTDIFSLGVLLYEMATGRRPFRSDSAAGLMSAILKDTPAFVRSQRPDLPEVLVDVITTCLEKDPARKFQSVAEIGAALKRAAQAPRAPVATRRPLVGREAERLVLETALDAAVRGEGSLILLGGEPGVGKTRLAAETLASGRARGMLALTGHAYEEEAVPFITAVEILEEMARTVPPVDLRRMLGDGAAEIARLMPELRQRYPDLPVPAELPPEQQRRYLFNSVLDFVGRAGRARPIVMLFDDLHWADESSLRLLEHVAPHVPGIPVLILGTYRDAELDVGKPFEKTLARLVRQKLARRCAIKRLALDDVAALLTALGGADVPPGLVRSTRRPTATRSSSRKSSSTWRRRDGCSTRRAAGGRTWTQESSTYPRGCGSSSGAGWSASIRGHRRL